MAPVMSSPSATMHAPVSVAVSMITCGFFSARYASESANTRRPSASVFSTSDVLPPRCVRMSPGFVAEPLGMFSLHGIAAITFTFGLSCAITRIVARIDAAPPMSSFIVSMFFASLIDRPPESNAMPLPVSAIGTERPPPRYVSSIMRGGFTLPAPTPRMPPKPPLLSSASPHTLHGRPTSRAIFCASRAICAGGMSPGRRVDEVARPVHGLGDDAAPLEGRPRRLRVAAPAAEHGHLADRLRQVLRRRAVAVEAVGTEEESSAVACMASRAPLPVTACGNVVAIVANRAAVGAALPRATRSRFASNPFLSPTPTSRTAPASNPSPAGTRSCSSRLPVSFAAAKAFWRPVSFTPGPGSGPAKTGRINRSARTEAAEPVVNERSATAVFLSVVRGLRGSRGRGQSIGSSWRSSGRSS
jgi:hypothetical protein